MSTSDFIAAIATAPGRGGIGVVRVSGPDLRTLVQGVAGRALSPRRATRARFLDGEGKAIDDGIAVYFPAPHSYTGEDVLELQGHGGPVVQRLVLERCIQLGCRLAEPGEFTRRAYLNDKLDLTQAESVIDLIDAATAAAARSAMRSLQGDFSQQIQTLISSLTGLRALVEATLDFPEEEIDFLKQHDAAGRLRRVSSDLTRVLEASRQGSLLRDGLKVVLAGRPNVGKSSLLNAMSGRDAAIVTDVPGTTRDTIREAISIGGLPVHVIDTAGLRESGDRIERLGIERTRLAIQDADLVLLVIDGIAGETADDRQIAASLPHGVRRIRIVNKIDQTGLAASVAEDGDMTTVRLSARTGAGLDALRATIWAVAGWHGEEGTILARARHIEALQVARAHLDAAAGKEATLELFAEELRLAQEALGSITGKVTADDLLGDIFSRFCIGK